MAIKMNTGVGYGNHIYLNKSPSDVIAVDQIATVCTWVYADTANAAGHIFALRETYTTSGTPYYGARILSNNYSVMKNAGGDETIVAVTGSAWQWICVQCSNEADNLPRQSRYAAYGASSVSAGGSVSQYLGNVAQKAFIVGERSSTSNDLPYPNTIAHVRVWNVLLDDTELAAEMKSATAVKTSGLVLAWELVSDASDSSGNGNNGTIVGANYSWVTGPTLSGASAVTAQASYYARLRA